MHLHHMKILCIGKEVIWKNYFYSSYIASSEVSVSDDNYVRPYAAPVNARLWLWLVKQV